MKLIARPSSRGAAESACRELLEIADVPIGGDAPHAIHVHDPRFYRKVLADALLGLGESYMDGWWDCEQLDEMIARMVRAQLRRRVLGSVRIASGAIWAKLTNMQSVARAFEVGRRHYDIGNAFWHAGARARVRLGELREVCRGDVRSLGPGLHGVA